LLDKGKVDGDLMKWGSSEAVLAMIGKIGRREDWIGDVLAEGVRSASKEIGSNSDKFALHVKGMEVPAYDPRGVWGMGLTYATSIRGACHLKSWTVAAEFANFDPLSTEGKAGLVKGIQDLRSVLDSLIVCFFAGRAITKDWIVKLINSVTDFGWKVEDIDTIGARIYDLERILATREGLRLKDDLLPHRIMEEPLTGGQSKGTKITQENMEKMLQEYYKLRSWNIEGIPSEHSVV
jgi:aldehyde:ferredoxin oxidoreductase